jgi:hypothetical protein
MTAGRVHNLAAFGGLRMMAAEAPVRGSLCNGSQGLTVANFRAPSQFAPAIRISLAAHFVMPAKKKQRDEDLAGEALMKETCRRIRVARSYWDAHNNSACRRERERALALYEKLTPEQREKVPQALRIWLRYRSEKYFGQDRTPPRRKSPKPATGLKRAGSPHWGTPFKGWPRPEAGQDG